MYAVTGITGRVGGIVARTLLADQQSVRAVVRDRAKGAEWAKLGCNLAVADMNDAVALTKAFQGMEGVFVMMPGIFDPEPGFLEARAIITAFRAALESARPAKVVYLSTIGAQATRTNLLTQLTMMEQALGALPMPVTFLRPAWFMENATWDVAPARDKGVIPSFLQPLDQPFPMVAIVDVGQVAAELLQDTWNGKRIVELEGERRVTPNDIARTFSKILGRTVSTEAVPRNSWEQLFRSQGMKNPFPRMQMLDGFNEGWIGFEGGQIGSLKGKIGLETVLRGLVENAVAV